MTRAGGIAANLAAVRARVRAAEAAAHRPAGTVRLIAVSKTMPPDDVRVALAAGQNEFAENYAQEFRDKRAAIPQDTTATNITWHFIGPLQRNKVKYVAGYAAMIHCVDSTELLAEIDRRAAAVTRVQDCLVQVNVAAEPQKHGVAPAALPSLLEAFAALANVRCRGLMLIPPASEDPEAARGHFAELRHLRDAHALGELSMGMSHDLEVAIAEGATMVRVGTAIFGARR